MTLPIDIQPAGPQLQMTMHITIPYIKMGTEEPEHVHSARERQGWKIDIPRRWARFVTDETPPIERARALLFYAERPGRAEAWSQPEKGLRLV